MHGMVPITGGHGSEHALSAANVSPSRPPRGMHVTNVRARFGRCTSGRPDRSYSMEWAPFGAYSHFQLLKLEAGLFELSSRSLVTPF
jgi:hypothetical protein